MVASHLDRQSLVQGWGPSFHATSNVLDNGNMSRQILSMAPRAPGRSLLMFGIMMPQKNARLQCTKTDWVARLGRLPFMYDQKC